MDKVSVPRIGFIGAGKVGVTLGAYLGAGGHKVAGYLSKNAGSARRAARITLSGFFTNINELVKACGIIFITTPDDQIAKVWDRLLGCDIAGRTVLHTSGSLSSDVFAGAKERHAYAYSVHPMFAFSQKDGNTEGLEDACFTIEGDEERLDEVCGLFNKMGNKTLLIGSGDKTLYHVANVTVSNLMLALVSLGFDCFQKCGIGREDAVLAAAPLIYGNIDNVLEKGFAGALTGPVERNDAGTIMKHAQALPEALRDVYALLTMRLVAIAQEKHPGRDYKQLMEVLAGLGKGANGRGGTK